MIVDFNPYSDRWRADPYTKYRELRDHAPVHHCAESDTWTVSRYDDVQYVFRHPELFSSQTRGSEMQRGPAGLARLRMTARFMWKLRAGPRKLMNARMLILEDGDTHTAMRDFVNR